MARFQQHLKEQVPRPSEDLKSLLKEKAQPISIADIYFKSKELERKGIEVIHLDVGEPDFEPPPEVVNATSVAIKEFKGRYTAAAGIYELRASIANRLNSKYQINILPEQVLFTAGGRLALYLAFSSLKKGAQVAIISPDWPAYRDLCNYKEFEPVFIHTSLKDSWVPNLGELRSKNYDAIVLNYPNNPTGKILDPKVMDEIVNIATEKKVTIISDEVYSDYVFQNIKFKSILEYGEDIRTIYASSFSKSHAMTGYRAGYVVSDKQTISSLERLNGLIVSSAPEFVQYAAYAALQCEDYVRDKRALIEERKKVVSLALKENGYADFYEPDGSLYFFLKIRSQDVSSIPNSEALALNLLDTVHVSVTPGTIFGPSFEDYIRITLLQDKERLRRGLELIGEMLGNK